MKYEKKPTTFEEQADKLLSRGLVADREELLQRLNAVSYYRLSGYLYPFRKPDSEQYREGTTLTLIWGRYCFDRRLRVLVLDAIERIEVSARTKLVHHFSHAHGPFGYLDDQNLPNLKIDEYLEWRTSLVEETHRSKETFAKHFFTTYGDCHKELPVWMLAEVMSMGSTLTFFKGVDQNIQRKIAAEYGLADELFLSWFRSLNAARNICAHHSRFWNRELGYAPFLPSKNKFPAWHGESKLKNNRTGIILMICRHMLALITPTTRWRSRVEELFAEYPDIPVQDMGLPHDWKAHRVWMQTVV
jgi:abortive infection bacteriophage resistance protein